MAGFDYGNARLRARRTRLLGPSDYAQLLGATDIDRLTGMLGEGTYGPEIESTLPLLTGVRRIDAAVGAHVQRQHTEACSFYDEPVRSRLRLVLGRWDARNLVALVRALAGRSAGPSLADSLLPTGRMSSGTLRELARQRDVRSMTETMVAWGVPSPQIAHAVLGRLAEFESSGDPVVVETAILQGLDHEITEVTGPDDRLTRQLDAERDRDDILMAARLREIRLGGEPLPDQPWIGDHRRRLEDLIESSDLESTIQAMPSLPPGFTPAVVAWAHHGDASRLADDLDRALLRLAVSGITQDPLGIGVPVGYMWQVENEARNLRLVARAVARHLVPEEAEARMVLV